MTPPAHLVDYHHYEGRLPATFGWLTEKAPQKKSLSTITPRRVHFTAACILHSTGYHPPLLLPAFLDDLEPLHLQQILPQQPDIDWQPNYSKYCERVQRNKLKRRCITNGELPFGFPREIHSSPLVWSGSELREDEYIFNLTQIEIREAETALKAFKGTICNPIFPLSQIICCQSTICLATPQYLFPLPCIRCRSGLVACVGGGQISSGVVDTDTSANLASKQPMSAISSRTFQLPILGPRIAKLANQLDFGRGFFVLRGFEPRNYSSEENVILYAGIASYVADKRGRQDEHGNMLRK